MFLLILAVVVFCFTVWGLQSDNQDRAASIVLWTLAIAAILAALLFGGVLAGLLAAIVALLVKIAFRPPQISKAE